MSATRIIRQPVVAGMFYPAKPAELREQVSDLLSLAGTSKGRKHAGGRIRGIIAPHAGYAYSGLTAAHAYSLVQGEKFDTVVIVSPSHREYFKAISVYSGDVYNTPLGGIEVNAKVRDKLVAASTGIIASDHGHLAEHALEVQLPFLQTVLPSFQLVPIVMGDQSPELCFELGRVLAETVRSENALLVASTDLSHYHPAATAERLDRVIISDIKHFDCEQLMNDLESRYTEACGGGPTVAVLSALKLLGVKNVEVVHYSNSGDTTGDYASVVGYLSAVAYS